ncbi:MAG: nicotinate phosphoribosyltransferase [Elusimicrobiota bacterium]|jgi:nicotinate phosphoribosyltransferase|nr:nicotinate phosphoribosyltransferase [Elusimicrobiota bacterium]
MIIESLLDCDLYKITMLRVYFHRFPNVSARFEFKCRTPDIVFTKEMIAEISDEIDNLCSLRFKEDELKWIYDLYYMRERSAGFIEFLRMYKLNRDYIRIEENPFRIYAQGPIFQSSMFEIFVLAIVNEVYYKHSGFSDGTVLKDGLERLDKKIELLKKHPILFADFGTRRRFSKLWQERVMEKLNSQLPRSVFGGSSNMFFAKKYKMPAIGTFAHEFVQLGQALDSVTLASSQKNQFQVWADEYRASLGTCLSDCLGFDYFLKDFDKYFANLFDGVRQDSGDPYECGRKLIEHYKKCKIDPLTKTLCFSDSLNIESAIKLNEYFKDKIKVSFGIGTNITNDVGLPQLNIVFKMTEANKKPVAKLSDTPEKMMCGDLSYVRYLRETIERELSRDKQKQNFV